MNRIDHALFDDKLLNQLVKKHSMDQMAITHREEALEKFNRLDNPKWKRAGIDETLPKNYQFFGNQKIMWHKTDGVSVENLLSYRGSYYSGDLDKTYGISEKHNTLVQTFSNAGAVVEIGRNVKLSEPIVIKMTLNDQNNMLIDHHMIHVAEGGLVTVLLDYGDELNEATGYHSGLLQITAEKGSQVHIIKHQNYSKRCDHFYGTVAVVKRDAKVSYKAIDIGGANVASNYTVYLEDENSQSDTESIYFGDGFSKLDIGYNTYHIGRRTDSSLLVKGALLDSSRKVFRGNLFFKRGAKRAVGKEEEYVILLDEKVKADAIPALMCDEDDVQGEHAASAGQIDRQKLFYLMSRGLSEKEAKQLIIMAAFAPIIDNVPVKGLKEQISEEVEKRLLQDFWKG